MRGPADALLAYFRVAVHKVSVLHPVSTCSQRIWPSAPIIPIQIAALDGFGEMLGGDVIRVI